MKKNLLVMTLTVSLAFCIGLFMDITQEKQTVNYNMQGSYESIDNQSFGWGIKKIKGDEPEVTNKQKEDLGMYNSFYMDYKKTQKIYLTFDEGYENGYTAQILDTLKEKQVPAAFFITGPYAKKETELVRRMIDEGHIVGNHTINHPNLAKLADSQKVIDEITELNELVLNQYSYEMKYVRPPEGEYSQRVLAICRDLGMRGAFWSFAYPDWNVNNQKGKDYAFAQVTPYIHKGAVLLLHAVSSDNAQALPDIIDWARNNGYEFCSLDEIE